jgi:AcrR family transcriptional regulator
VTPDPDTATPSVGRPRRYDDATERAMLVDAAVRVVERTGSVSVADVLSDAGLSTRAFYRHFDSKEALLETLMLREAEAVGASLARVVARAPDPVAAVSAWLERFLDVFYDPRRAARAAQLSSAAFVVSRPSAEMIHEMRRMSSAPLAEALRAGHASGVLHSPTPEADARSVYDLVNAGHDAGDTGADRAATRAHVVRFAWPALRLDGPTGA